jgi:hypothetical protein
VASLGLEQIRESWRDVLQAVRRRNPTTYGALNTDCEPVEASGDEVVITFPHAFLRQKLNDPQRKEEIQAALAEVLHLNCRARFVLASEYKPNRPASPVLPTSSEPRTSKPAPDGQIPDELTRWAAQRGGQVQVIPPPEPTEN